MGVALGLGYLPCAFLGLSPWLGLTLGAVAIGVLVLVLGKRADDPLPAQNA